MPVLICTSAWYYVFPGLATASVPRSFDLPELFRTARFFVWMRRIAGISYHTAVTGHNCQCLPLAHQYKLSRMLYRHLWCYTRHDRHTGLSRSAWSLDPRRAGPTVARVRAVLGQRCAHAWPHGAGRAGEGGPRARNHKPERRR